MRKRSLRTLGSQLGVAVAGGVVAVALTGGSFAFAQSAPEAGTGVAEALAGPNTVNSAAIINGSVNRADLKAGVAPLWAHVDGGTTVNKIAGKGVTLVNRQGTGIYRVVFSQAITGCGWVATRTDNSDGVSAGGEISVELENASGLPNNVWVRTYNSAGVLADTNEDEGFTVTALC